MTIEMFLLLLSWVVSGGILGVITFLVNDEATTLGDLVLMIFLFVLSGWVGVGATILYHIGIGVSWLFDRDVFKIELKTGGRHRD